MTYRTYNPHDCTSSGYEARSTSHGRIIVTYRTRWRWELTGRSWSLPRDATRRGLRYTAVELAEAICKVDECLEEGRSPGRLLRRGIVVR